MDVLAALNWVEENKSFIEGWLAKKLMFTPYDMEDYLQDAKKIAIVAANTMSSKENESDTEFHSVFWQLFKEEVAAVTPCPIDDERVKEELFTKAVNNGLADEEAKDKALKQLQVMKDTERRRRSMSIPSSFAISCDETEFMDFLIEKDSVFKTNKVAEIDIDAAISAASRHLKELDQTVLVMTLGYCEGGRHTQVEIGKKINRDYRNVRIAQERIRSKLNEARSKGLFDPDQFVRYRDPYEPQAKFA